MTDNTTNKPAFHIFTQQDGQTKRIGTAFKHRKGDGYNLLINGVRYAAFPPKANPAKEEGA